MAVTELLKNEPKQNNFELTRKEFEYFMLECGFTIFEKKVFESRWLGLTNNEIASSEHCSLSTVNRAIKKIKKKIEKVLLQK